MFVPSAEARLGGPRLGPRFPARFPARLPARLPAWLPGATKVLGLAAAVCLELAEAELLGCAGHDDRLTEPVGFVGVAAHYATPCVTFSARQLADTRVADD